MFWTVGYPDPGKKQAQIVVDLGDGAYRRAWIVGRGFLFNTDCR